MPTTLKKLTLVVRCLLHHPKNTHLNHKNFSSNTVTDVPTEERERGFLLAVITITGISLAIDFDNIGKEKIIISRDNFKILIFCP